MIVRDSNGKLCVISRKKCKNDVSYYQKLYDIQLAYEKLYPSSIIHVPKVINVPNKNNYNNFSDFTIQKSVFNIV
jgi:hypothetical protein